MATARSAKGKKTKHRVNEMDLEMNRRGRLSCVLTLEDGSTTKLNHKMLTILSRGMGDMLAKAEAEIAQQEAAAAVKH